MSDLAPLVIAAAKARGLMIATAESCTGGMIAAALTDIAGSSAVFERGFVTYSNAAKTEMLGVPAETIAQYGAVSEEVASAMAAGALAHSRAAIAVSVTGIAGPGGSEHKPEGRVCFGLARTGAPPQTWTCEYGAIGRGLVRHHTREHALSLILTSVK
ncbi:MULTISPECIES: CinA family protein [Thioclava]|uniref:CinA family protein n=1 Tax=Thioclava kandeliae TaxID=3070818 RepID=A0ABV1SC49_9RHOB